MTLLQVLQWVLVAVLSLAAILSLFVAILYVGFRMGRKTVGKPEPSLFTKPTESLRLVEEDPFYRPMTGRQQPNIPTLKENKR